MSVPEYLETFGLPADYPMVSNDYSLRRSLLAKAAGLGVKTGRAQQVFPQERPDGVECRRTGCRPVGTFKQTTRKSIPCRQRFEEAIQSKGIQSGRVGARKRRLAG